MYSKIIPLLVAVCVGGSLDAQLRVAMTVDDLPWTAPVDSATVARGLSAIIGTLVQREIPATGLVVCQRHPENRHSLDEWHDAGLEIGNHSYSHMDLNYTDTNEWIADVRRCDSLLRTWGFRPDYFRFPMLHQGPTQDVRDTVASAVARMGYTTAHVTIDNSEWLLASAYRSASDRGDVDAMTNLRSLYTEHLVRALLHADSVSHERFGRSVNQILLVHANQILADGLPQLIYAYEQLGVEWISLREALRDPIYILPDDYVGPRGLSWLYRAAPVDESWAEWDEAEEENIRYLISDI